MKKYEVAEVPLGISGIISTRKDQLRTDSLIKLGNRNVNKPMRHYKLTLCGSRCNVSMTLDSVALRSQVIAVSVALRNENFRINC